VQKLLATQISVMNQDSDTTGDLHYTLSLDSVTTGDLHYTLSLDSVTTGDLHYTLSLDSVTIRTQAKTQMQTQEADSTSLRVYYSTRAGKT
jgi:hypothetical protein